MSSNPEDDFMETDASDAEMLADVEMLTAYLDGELTGDMLASVEQRLLDDEDFRLQMQKLQSSWDMLDALPQTGHYDAFVRTTMELVAQAADDENNGKIPRFFPSWLGWLVGLIAIPAAACWAGFAATDLQNKKPLEELLCNLPLIENYDRYQRAGLDIDFLQQLADADLFTSDVTSLFPEENSSPQTQLDHDVSLDPPPETLQKRKGRLQSLPPRQLESIQRNKAEFDALASARKKEVAEFHRQLIQHPRHQEINRTLISYYDWLKSLGQSELIRLLDTPEIPARIEQIAEKIEQQNLEAFGKVGVTMLPAADAEQLFRWYDALIKKNQRKIRKSASVVFVQAYKKQYSQDPPAADLKEFTRRPLSQIMGFIFKHDRARIEPLITVGDISELKYVLSAEANDILDAGLSVAERTRLIVNWIDAANQSRFSISKEALREFYEGLSVGQRDELDNLSPADWRSSLIRMYRQRQLKNNNGFGEGRAIFGGT